MTSIAIQNNQIIIKNGLIGTESGCCCSEKDCCCCVGGYESVLFYFACDENANNACIDQGYDEFIPCVCDSPFPMFNYGKCVKNWTDPISPFPDENGNCFFADGSSYSCSDALNYPCLCKKCGDQCITRTKQQVVCDNCVECP